jgi:DNA-binding NarL/FixJ family response regulator
MVFDTHSSGAAPHEILSDREFQVLHLLAAGKSVNAISRRARAECQDYQHAQDAPHAKARY